MGDITPAVNERDQAEARRTVRALLALLAVLAIGLTCFVTGTVVDRQNQSAAVERAVKDATAAQHSSGANQARIFAVCAAMHSRDLLAASKWARVTKVEFSYVRPNNNAVDAAYHHARRVALKQAAQDDQAMVRSDCFQDVENAERAYERNGHSATTHRAK